MEKPFPQVVVVGEGGTVHGTLYCLCHPRHPPGERVSWNCDTVMVVVVEFIISASGGKFTVVYWHTEHKKDAERIEWG